MGNLIPKNELLEQASRASYAVEKFIDTRIWRTRMRIHELILRDDNSLKHNQFIADQGCFLYMLLSLGFNGEVQTLKGSNLYRSGEQYEEGSFQPILFGDLQDKDKEPYLYVCESIYQSGIEGGRKFYDIKASLDYNAKIVVPRVRECMINHGVAIETVYYKKPHGKKDNKESFVPMLPATIE